MIRVTRYGNQMVLAHRDRHTDFVPMLSVGSMELHLPISRLSIECVNREQIAQIAVIIFFDSQTGQS